MAAYRPSSDASEATVAYHLRIEPALDVLHSLGQRQWGEQRRITYIYIFVLSNCACSRIFST